MNYLKNWKCIKNDIWNNYDYENIIRNYKILRNIQDIQNCEKTKDIICMNFKNILKLIDITINN